MRFHIVLTGETDEGVETRAAMELAVAAFGKSLSNIGYPVMWDVDYGCCPEGDLEVDEPLMVVVSEVPDGPENDPPLIDRIRALQDAASNAHMSQRELAEALGVTRYAIKKALKGG